MNPPWNAATAAACGIDELVRAIAPGCGFGRAAWARQVAFRPGDEAAATAASARAAALAAAASVERIVALRAAIAAVPDPLPAAQRATLGETLGDADFHDLLRFGVSLEELAPLADFGGLRVPAGAPELAAALAPGRTASGGFYLDAAFDVELATARADAEGRQAAYDAIRGALATRVAATLGRDGVRDGEFIVLREALPPAAPPDVRVVRETPAFVVFELALDGAGSAALAERDAAADAVARCEERVRARLSALVAESAAALAAACSELGEMDLLAARGAFAAREDGVVPALGGAALELDSARFPPLAERLAARGRPYVPISIELAGPAVVTGPNMGGKTAALRTIGFAAACAALGVPVPARSARLPLFGEIVWLGVTRAGAGSQDDDLLSSFGAELVALRSVLGRTEDDSVRPMLVLVDEFARTTAPAEGRALLVATLSTFGERGVLGLAATHFGGVAEAAGIPHFATGRVTALAPAQGDGVRSLRAALDAIGGGMDYALVAAPERPGDSGALALAAALGLDPALVARAEAVLGAAGG